jgi:hypothetical protein
LRGSLPCQTVNWLVIDNALELKRIAAVGADWMRLEALNIPENNCIYGSMMVGYQQVL